MSKRRPLDLTLGIIGLLCAVGALSAIAISGIVPMDDRLIAGLGVGAVLLLVIAALMDFVRNPEARKCVWETALVLGLAIILAQLFKYVVLPLLALVFSVELPKVSDTTLIIILLIVIVGLLATIADKLSGGSKKKRDPNVGPS